MIRENFLRISAWSEGVGEMEGFRGFDGANWTDGRLLRRLLKTGGQAVNVLCAALDPALARRVGATCALSTLRTRMGCWNGRERHTPGHGENPRRCDQCQFWDVFRTTLLCKRVVHKHEKGMQLSFGIKTGNPEKVRGCLKGGIGTGVKIR